MWAHQQGLTLSAGHLKGSLNVRADLLSRPDSILPMEWTLAQWVLQPLWQMWGKPLLDLFATRYSARLPVFVSPVPDDLVWEIDALSLDFTGMEAYAFLPFALIPQVLWKAHFEQPRLILVAPLWPWLHWDSLLQDLAHGMPLPLQVGIDGISQPRSHMLYGNPQAQPTRVATVRKALRCSGLSK